MVALLTYLLVVPQQEKVQPHALSPGGVTAAAGASSGGMIRHDAANDGANARRPDERQRSATGVLIFRPPFPDMMQQPE
jgi:hypothetical protein